MNISQLNHIYKLKSMCQWVPPVQRMPYSLNVTKQPTVASYEQIG